jgi:hypothetical protein
MTITADRMYEDLMSEFNTWVASGTAPNHFKGKMYATGYGGPRNANEEINLADFEVNKKKWLAFGKTGPKAKTDLNSPNGFTVVYFCADPSFSGLDAGVYDFKCAKHDDMRVFAYHIVVTEKIKK